MLVIVLLVGGYFRFIGPDWSTEEKQLPSSAESFMARVVRVLGSNWDEGQHLHPDERFMATVAHNVRSVSSLSQYFNTERSPLNPLRWGSYTYGVLPLVVTRYVAEWISTPGYRMTEYDRIVLVGRVLSGLFDLAAVLLLYRLGTKLYDRRIGLLAAALSAAAVLPIQLSHYFAVDSFATVFILSAFCAALPAIETGQRRNYAAFGALTGLALACKMSTAPLAGVILLAGLVRLIRVWPEPRNRRAALKEVVGGWVIAGVMAGLLFRFFQPHAFAGPGFFGLRLNQRWLDIMTEVAHQVAGRADYPPNHHWTNRSPLTFAWANAAFWGLGLPLGMAATLGWAWAVWRCWQRKANDWQRHLLPVVWVGGYFVWQNVQFWRYMRYFLPVYPLAILLAAWALIEVWDRARAPGRSWRATPRLLALLLLVGVTASTYAYAFAFTRVYTRSHTRVSASRWMLQNIPGPLNLTVTSAQGSRQLPIPVPFDLAISPSQSWHTAFASRSPGTISKIAAPRLLASASQPDNPTTLEITIARDEPGRDPLLTVSTRVDASGVPQELSFPPIPIKANETYHLIVTVTSGSPITLGHTTLAMETSWDDALPLRVDGHDPLGGIFRALNLELFEPDDEAKLKRMLEVLARADYLIIPSNRAYDAMPRLPLRYPLTLKYYQALFDCSQQDIVRCAYPAQPPLRSSLGFDLIATFESNPSLGPVSFSDQKAEEAFTVYDHPKVLIFKKAPQFSLERVRAILTSVDLTQVLDQSPSLYTAMPTGLRLPADRLEAQTAGGTWTTIFDPDALINARQELAAVAWYLTLLLVGWLAFPLVFIAFRGLPDRGYPLAKLIGMLILAWFAWMAGSYKLLPFTRASISAGLLLLAVVSFVVARRHWAELRGFLWNKWRTLLLVEGLTLGLFALDLWIRWNNPDLWHPWLGGEKPADYSFFLAVLKSVYFPPYDAWLSGHYVNYYYYGFVVSAIPTKLLGIVPSVAYNLVIPTLYAFAGIAAFCAAYGLAWGYGRQTDQPSGSTERLSLLAGVMALSFMVLIGNLFQVRLLWRYLPELAERRAGVGTPSLVGQAGAVVSGAWRVVTGEAELPGEKGRWYFGASRAIQHDGADTPITEFPLFSFLYADLHPHLVDMSIILASVAWMLSVLLAASGQPRQRWPETVAFWLMAGLVFGAMQPTHTWDFPVFLGLGALALGASVWFRQRQASRATMPAMTGHVALLVALAVTMYHPFRQWFATTFSAVELWTGARTRLVDYLTVHGLFLFILVTLLVFETREWIKARAQAEDWLHTPLGALLPQVALTFISVAATGVAALSGALWFWFHDSQALVLVWPIVLWIGLLLLRSNQPLAKQILLVLFGAGASLTLIVEIIVLKGDLGRSNTVFKVYVQVWALFSVTAAVALAWLLQPIRKGWTPRWRRGWLGALVVLILAAGTYTLTATRAKMTDRWPNVARPPRSLDGMAYMLGSGETGAAGTPTQPAIYDDDGRKLRLDADYGAIRWMQRNLVGTPVIVEGNTPLYRWGSRYAIYTGLPTVIGWDWHVKLHDSVLPGTVIDRRLDDVRNFYNTLDPTEARRFLERYHVQYVIVGELERVYYAPGGLAKFARMVEGGELQVVYATRLGEQNAGAVIYRVNRPR